MRGNYSHNERESYNLKCLCERIRRVKINDITSNLKDRERQIKTKISRKMNIIKVQQKSMKSKNRQYKKLTKPKMCSLKRL